MTKASKETKTAQSAVQSSEQCSKLMMFGIFAVTTAAALKYIIPAVVTYMKVVDYVNHNQMR